jgi:hypothetical protein
VNSIPKVALNLGKILSAIRFTALLFGGALVFSQSIHAADLQKPPPWEAKPFNKGLLNAQVQSLTEKDFAPLKAFSSTQSKVDRIASELTATAIQGLQARKDAAFDRDAAAVFGIWMQDTADTLVRKEDTAPGRIKTTKIAVFGLIFWMVTDEDLNPLPAIKITLDIIKKAYDALCPHYPFC